MVTVDRILQLDPEPPEPENLNDYIVKALDTGDLHWFLCFLHHYEGRLNGRINGFLIREGLDRYDPERRLNYKMGVVLALLESLPGYDPAKEADFLTYTHRTIGNALLECRRQEEAGSFRSLDEYKAARKIAWLWNQDDKTPEETAAVFSKSQGCTIKTAEELLTVARRNRSRTPFYATSQDDEEETGEDVTRDDSWNYAEILWDGVRAGQVEAAFRKLSYRDQTLLEKRNALCMTCGRTSPMSQRASFEDLAAMFEGSGASGAERAYRKAVEKLTQYLVEAGALHVAEIRRVSQTKKRKKITAAVWEYCADYDGEWGEIQFDLEAGEAEIRKLAEWDNRNSQPFARKVISRILKNPGEELPKKMTIPFETYESGGENEPFWSWPL